MPSETLHDFKSGTPGFITEWTVTATSAGDGLDVTCTKDGETDKTHFVTFLTCSTNNTEADGTLVGKLWDGVIPGSGSVGLKLEVWPVEQDGTPSIFNFSSPIQMTEGYAVNFKGEISAGDQCTFTVGGFTSNVRID
tara:strand:- start:78 stop:488 length:411 start_codon:yes stop_codon:yes gene_type:complete